MFAFRPAELLDLPPKRATILVVVAAVAAVAAAVVVVVVVGVAVVPHLDLQQRAVALRLDAATMAAVAAVAAVVVAQTEDAVVRIGAADQGDVSAVRALPLVLV